MFKVVNCILVVYDGDFSPWSDGVQSDCTPLGAGTVCDFTRTRTCTNPSPTNGGDDCVGELTDVSEGLSAELRHIYTFALIL